MTPALLTLLLLTPGPTPAPAAAGTDARTRSHCATCHLESSWHEVRFDHDTTHFPLRDSHAQQSCRQCHQDIHRLQLDTRCQSCHVDTHAGRLGQDCQRCHDEKSFQSGAGVQAHGMSRFPLLGRHAWVSCEKCHQARADRTFGGVPVNCAACHMARAAGTAGTQRDHAGLSQPPACERCHGDVGWLPARYPEHEACFPIQTGPHRGISCANCHSSLRGLGAQNCSTFSAACSRCHLCGDMDREHRQEHRVAGYQCADRKCYECHPGGRE